MDGTPPSSNPPCSSSLRRREGFPGQYLVVLPRPQIEACSQNPLLRDLFVAASGSFPRAAGHYVERTVGIDDWILIHARTGVGWVEIPGSAREPIQAGQFFLIARGIPHSYGADELDPWALEWIHFQGESAGAFCALFPADPSGLYIYPAKAERLDFSMIYETLEAGYTRRNLIATAASLRMILTELSLLAERASHSTGSEAIRENLLWMKQNLGSPCTLPELARHAGYSVAHYSALFRKVTGFAPMEHFLRLKIQRACQLLDTTELRVGEIAATLGWEDPFYFSRCFRRITGKSPRAYREVTKG